MTVRLAALGDSTSCGQGVGLRLPLERTWPALLAARAPGTELLPLARPGARVRDVVALQLPTAVAARPRVATLLAGLNDVARAGFDDAAVQRDLLVCTGALVQCGTTVVLGRLHDPVARLPLPGALRREVLRRTAVVNEAVDVAARHPSVVVLDLAAQPVLRTAEGYEHDRLHPSALGHHALAAAAAALLDLPGDDAPGPAAEDVGVLAQLDWLVRHALPWLVAHRRSVLLPAARACLA